MNNGIVTSLKYACRCEKAELFGAQKYIRRVLSNKETTQDEEALIRELIAHLDFFQFYCNIAKATGLDALDPRVVSMYWLGDNMPGENFHNWTTLLPVLNLPMERIEIQQLDDCFVHPAVVHEVGSDKLVVSYNPVVKNGDNLELGQATKREVTRDLLTDQVDDNSSVAMHFGGAIQKIDSKTYSNLQQLTIDALAKFNAARRV